jgi:TrpR-related protein YerC/YecD
MSRKLKDSDIAYLYRAILSLQDEQECDRFFEDLCTISEIKSLLSAWLSPGCCTSHKTIQISVMKRESVRRPSAGSTAALEYGADGYKLVLERLENR